MDLNLKKPIIFFDLETTGTNVAKDRIVEIAILKIFPNGNKESKTWLVNPEIKIAWHSCGSIVPIIPDFIELGLDILNPIQPRAKDMTPEFLKREYGKDLIFFGGIDVQELLPFKSPDEIRSDITRKCQILGKGGGYIAAPAHNIQPDTPVENVFAMYDAIIKFNS